MTEIRLHQERNTELTERLGCVSYGYNVGIIFLDFFFMQSQGQRQVALYV